MSDNSSAMSELERLIFRDKRKDIGPSLICERCKGLGAVKIQDRVTPDLKDCPMCAGDGINPIARKQIEFCEAAAQEIAGGIMGSKEVAANANAMDENTLEDLLRMKVTSDGKDGPVEMTPDFRVAVQGQLNGGIHFIIHPNGHSGDTLDFVVNGNHLASINWNEI